MECAVDEKKKSARRIFFLVGFGADSGDGFSGNCMVEPLGIDDDDDNSYADLTPNLRWACYES